LEEKYFFLESDEKIATEIFKRVNMFQEFAIAEGYYYNWYKNKKYYHGYYFGYKGSDIVECGDQSELHAATFNHFRNVLRHTINQASGDIPSFSVSASNTDPVSRRASRIGKDIINYYFKVKRCVKYINEAIEYGVVQGDGYVVCEYNPLIGEEHVSDETGTIRKKGDLDLHALGPTDVFFDVAQKSKEDWQWVIFRTRKNKYNLAAAFPDLAEDILSIPAYFEIDKYFMNQIDALKMTYAKDEIYIYSAYHNPCEIMPNGGYCMFAGNFGKPIFLFRNVDKNGKDFNPYGRLPIFYISPSKYMDTSFGRTDANDLRSPQEMLTVAVSSMISNAAAFSANNIWCPDGNVEIEELLGGMNLIKSSTKPEVVSFFQQNPAFTDLMNICIGTIETLSAQSAVVRGDLEKLPQLKSGIALMTVLNQSKEFSQALIKSVYECYEDLGTFILETLQRVATVERFVEVVGKMNTNAVVSFTSDDIKAAKRVVVDRTNPIANQPAGQIEIADNLLQKGQLSKTEFLNVVNTGKLQTATESDERMLDFIAVVKEKLLKGETMVAIHGINHQLYIKELQALVFDADILTNPNNQTILKNIMELVQAQLEIVREGDEVANFIYGGTPPTPRVPLNQPELMPLGQTIAPQPIGPTQPNQ